MGNKARRLYHYANRVHDLDQELAEVGDGRSDPTYPLKGLLWKTLAAILSGLPSFNQFEERIAKGNFDRIGGRRRPRAGAFSYAFERVDLEGLQAVSDHVIRTARRNKSLEATRVEGHRVVAIDGSGTFSTVSKRLGKHAHHRRDVHGEKTQDERYLEHMLAVSYVGDAGPKLLLDLQRIPPGKGETTVAVWVLLDLFRRHCRYCDIVTVDALYAGAPFLNEVLRQNKDFVVRVKRQDYRILRDAEGLFAKQAPAVHKGVKLDEKSRVAFDLAIWEAEGFTSWEAVDEPLRVVKVRECRQERNADGEVVHEQTVTTHFVTSCPQATVAALVVWKIAHRRWDVENTGFRFLKHHFQIEHAYSYDPPVIQAMYYLFMLAFNLFQLLVHRNLKAFDPQRETLLGVMWDLYTGWVALTKPLQWSRELAERMVPEAS